MMPRVIGCRTRDVDAALVEQVLRDDGSGSEPGYSRWGPRGAFGVLAAGAPYQAIS